MGVNKVIYNGKTLMDTTGVTVTPETLVKGATAIDAAGDEIAGEFIETDPTVPEWAKAATKPSYGTSEINGLFDLIYPIGRIIYTTNAANPSTYLGGGTWTQIEDVFLLAAGNTYAAGSTGGEAEHTLTDSEIPMHSHPTYNGSGWAYFEVHRSGTAARTQVAASSSSGKYTFTATTSSDIQWPYNASGTSGGDEPHNNMPPYLAVYVWTRTA